jgi:peroxiredoxin (alkyl hydroperoxide reductase subunit C)
MSEAKDGCVTPAKGPIMPEATAAPTGVSTLPTQEVTRMLARVGKPAPDFEATAFTGKGFAPVRLSDYKGKWIVVCFYPGDFTFV